MAQQPPSLGANSLPDDGIAKIDRLETEIALLRAELARERDLANQTSDYIFTLSAEGNFLHVNPAAERDYGYTLEEFLGLNMAHILDPESMEDASTQLRQRLAGEQETELSQFLTRTRAGDPIWVELRTHRLRDADGQVVGVQGIARNITEAQEGRLRVLFEEGPDPILITDEHGRILDANPSACLLLSYTREQLRTLRAGDLFPAGSEDVRRTLQGVLDGVRQQLETDLLDAHGRRVPVELVVNRLSDGRLLAVVRDISERREMERALRDSEDRYRSVVDNATDFIYELDAKGNLIFANPAALAVFGRDPDDLPGADGSSWNIFNIFTIIHPDDIDHVVRHFSPEYFAEDRSRRESIRVRLRRQDGSIIWLESRGQIRPAAGDHGPTFLGIARDITEQRVAMDALAESEARLRSLVQNAPVILFATDADGRFTMVDGKALADLSPPPGDWLGKAPADAAPADMARAIATALQGEPLSDLFELNGVLFDHHYTPVRDDSGRVSGVIGVCVNVQEQRQLEEQLRHAQKMEAVGRLAGGIAHDFNNILSVISGFSELALLSISDTHPLHESLSEIRQAGQSGAALTRQLLAFSRRQVLEPVVLDLPTVVGGLEPMLTRLLREEIRFDTRLSREPCPIHADPGQIEQVLMNLIVNAGDALGAGGAIQITVSRRDLAEAESRGLALDTPGSYVVLTVADNGPGMDAQTRDRVFEPFFTTKPPGKGTGLGLATVYGIVRQSDGAIRVDSEPGQGTTFSLYFPEVVLPEVDASTRGAPAETSALPRGSERVLLVEDEDAVRRMVARVLTDCGYDVVTAADGDEALTLAAAMDPPPDLLFTDVVMPGIDAAELVERLRRALPQLHVLYTSGYVDGHRIEADDHPDGLAYLQKPVSYEDVAWGVRRALDRALT